MEKSGDKNNSIVTKNSRLGTCEVCATNVARYTCPKCEVKTCCLDCVKIHKIELDCNGIRDRTKYIAIRDMNNTDFMSDYYFLEECTRYVEDRKTDSIKHNTWHNKLLPIRLHRMRNAAINRKILLYYLPPSNSRHKRNTSYYDWKKEKLFWCVEWIFVNANGLKYVDKNCSEDDTLIDLLDKYVNVDNSARLEQKKALEYYHSVDPYRLKVYLKAEGIKKCGTRFYPLKMKKTLKKNLMNKALLEFPSIYVSYDESMEEFDIIGSDEDISTELETHKSLVSAQYTNLNRNSNSINIASTHTVSTDNSQPSQCQEHYKVTNVIKSSLRTAKKHVDIHPRNFLFSNEKLLDELSSSSSTSDEDIK